MKSETPIRGKVARLLNAREVALNIGSREGVAVGMVFEILDPKSEDITDPDSGEVLGSLSRPKIQVKITRVEERVSLASTFRSRQVNVGGQGGFSGAGIAGIAKLFQDPEWVTQYETFEATRKGWKELDEADSFVRVGDPVVQVVGTEEVETRSPTRVASEGSG